MIPLLPKISRESKYKSGWSRFIKYVSSQYISTNMGLQETNVLFIQSLSLQLCNRFWTTPQAYNSSCQPNLYSFMIEVHSSHYSNVECQLQTVDYRWNRIHERVYINQSIYSTKYKIHILYTAQQCPGAMGSEKS